jgi:hypothetical protein
MNISKPTIKRLSGFFGQVISCIWIKGACLATLITLLGGCQMIDMIQFSYANATASHRWADEARTTTLHFELIDDHIILPVSVNAGEPLNFVLDSGAGATVIFESRNTQSLSLKLGAELPVSGVGTGPNPVAYIVDNTDISLGNVDLEGLSVLYLSLESVPLFANLDEVYFDGVIGAPFFERFVVEIDYDQQLISFSEPGSAKARINERATIWKELPLQIESGVPYLTTLISTSTDKSIAVKLLVDTGYRGPISLTPETHEEIRVPFEHFSTVSQGLSGDVETLVGMSESLNIGSFVLNDLPVSYSISGGESENSSNGLLGSEVLGQFNLVFDYPNERMFIAPNQYFGEPINADKSGLLIRPHRLGAVVKSIAKDSAGDAIELRVGDVITSVNDEPVTRSNITKLKRLLASDREIVPVCWLSSDQPHCEELTLRSRLKKPTL